MEVPAWLKPSSPSSPSPSSNSTGPLPDWLAGPRTPRQSPEARELLFKQFELVFPRLLEMIYSGATLQSAIKDLPRPYNGLDPGALTKWIHKDPARSSLYKEAKEIRTEAWSGEMIRHALGEDTTCELDRSKFVVDTYKWLMKSHNRKEYGESKSIELNTTISITAALSAANSRAEVVDVDLLDGPDSDSDRTDPRLLAAAAVDDEDEEGDE